MWLSINIRFFTDRADGSRNEINKHDKPAGDILWWMSTLFFN
jgi:hypothetical protein